MLGINAERNRPNVVTVKYINVRIPTKKHKQTLILTIERVFPEDIYV